MSDVDNIFYTLYDGLEVAKGMNISDIKTTLQCVDSLIIKV